MYWIIQNNIFNEPFYNKMISFFDKTGIEYEIIKAIPFTGEMIPEPSPTQNYVVAIGSYSFTNKAKEKWYPGSWTNDNYNYHVWSQEWREFVLNKDAEIYKFGEVPFQETPFFIRPCADDKLFTGQVIDWGDFEEWRMKVLNLKEYSELNYDSEVLISPPKKITEEYRFIIVDGKVITGSLYKQGIVGLYKEVEDHQTELINFVKKVISVWTPSKVFALDIALSNGTYYVLEMGNINSAGLYHCDIQKFIMSVEELYPEK